MESLGRAVDDTSTLRVRCGCRNMRDTRFPGHMPQTLCRTTLRHVARHTTDYRVTKKTDGTRVLCLITTDSAYVCNRALKFRMLAAEVPVGRDALLLDGELVCNTGRARLLVFDAPRLPGNLIARVSAARALLGDIRVTGLDLQVKTFYALRDAGRCLDRIQHDEATPNDGLVLTPLVGDGAPLKWKWSEHLTCDLLCRRGVLHFLSGRRNGTLVPLRGGFADATANADGPDMVWECRYMANCRWKRQRRRADRAAPNTFLTIADVLVAQAEDIRAADMRALFRGKTMRAPEAAPAMARFVAELCYMRNGTGFLRVCHGDGVSSMLCMLRECAGVPVRARRGLYNVTYDVSVGKWRIVSVRHGRAVPAHFFSAMAYLLPAHTTVKRRKVADNRLGIEK